MRLPIRLLVFSLLIGIGFGQHCLAESSEKVQVGKLVIESKTLSDADRKRVIHQFQHITYAQNELGIREELSECVRRTLRNLGYFDAVVDEPAFSFITADRGERIANVTVKVKEGEQYRLGKIQFRNATLFPADQLRKLFALQEGDLFNVSKIGDGLEHLMELYQAAGYAEVVVVPQEVRDKSLHTVDFVIDLDEGKQYCFGHLILDGLEPHVGAGQALLNSWKTLQGKQYSPIVLHQWLVTNQSNWQAGRHKSNPITTMPDGESRVVNVKLSFPWAKPPGLN